MANYSVNLCPDNSFINSFTPGGGAGVGGSNFPTGLTVGVDPNQVKLLPNSNDNILLVSDYLWVGTNLSNTPRVQVAGTGMNLLNTANNSIPFLLAGESNASLDFIDQINTYPVASSGNSGPLLIQQGVNTDSGPGSIAITLLNPFKDANYTVCATRQDAAPTQIPWAKITDPQNFTIACDGGATIGWVAVGNSAAAY